ncbi:MAG: MlaE family ABC transporter permease, partial [Gemmatimonadota bacterium]
MSQGWYAPLAWVGRSAIGTVAGLGRFGQFLAGGVRALPDIATWGGLLAAQMARLGVASLPIALFIAAFTGIVLALQASYTFTGAIPLYFVGVLVGKTMILELGPVLTGLALAGRVGANIAAEIGTMRVT